MANQQRPDKREGTQINGLAKDMDIVKTATKTLRGYPQLQGYLTLLGGMTLLFFSFGFFPFLKWVIGAAGIVMILIGTVQSNVIERISKFVQQFKR